jgi:hypothetical protein
LLTLGVGDGIPGFSLSLTLLVTSVLLLVAESLMVVVVASVAQLPTAGDSAASRGGHRPQQLISASSISEPAVPEAAGTATRARPTRRAAARSTRSTSEAVGTAASVAQHLERIKIL